MRTRTSPEVLYRYQPVRPDAIDLIKRARLWFSDPARFNDPFDILPSFHQEAQRYRQVLDEDREREYWQNPSISGSRTGFLSSTEGLLNAQVAKLVRRDQRQFKRDLCKAFRVTCFSAISNHLLMWSHYANGHRGICFGLRPSHIPVTPEQGYRWKIAYRSNRSANQPRNAPIIALSKSKEWRYEREWRILMAKEDLQGGRRPIFQGSRRTTEQGHFLALPWSAFESVRFGAEIEPKDKARILKLLSSPERSRIRIIQMHLSYSKYCLEEEILR